MFERQLISLGLNQKETRVYLAVLELGEVLASSLARRTGIKRTTVYHILENLHQKGLVTFYEKKKARYFSPVDAGFLLKICQEKVERAEAELEEFSRILPQLKTISNFYQASPPVRFFDGKEGIKRIYQDILRTEKSCFVFSNQEELFRIFPDFSEFFTRKRIEKKMALLMIMPFAKNWRFQKEEKEKSLRACQSLTWEKFPFQGEIWIYGHKVVIISFTEIKAVLIEDQKIALMFRAIFDFCWEMSGVKGRESKLSRNI